MNEEPFVSYTSQPQPVKNHKGLKITLIVLLVLALLGAAGYGGYYLWNKNRALQTDVSNRDTEIKDLKAQVADLSAEDTTAEADKNRFKIQELGVSLQLPEKLLKDVTYSYMGKSVSTKYDGHNARFSTKALTDLDKNCAASGTAPLGILTKVTGQYPKEANVETTPGQLVKQFSDYYIAFTSPQAACSDSKLDTTVTEALTSFKDTFSTIKEL
jgi:hypothetical protein